MQGLAPGIKTLLISLRKTLDKSATENVVDSFMIKLFELLDFNEDPYGLIVRPPMEVQVGIWKFSSIPDFAITYGDDECILETGIEDAMVLPTMLRRKPALHSIQATITDLWVRGATIRWQKAFMGASNDNRDRLTVQLVNLAHGLGLHLDCSNWQLPDWEIGLRRRIGW